ERRETRRLVPAHDRPAQARGRDTEAARDDLPGPLAHDGYGVFRIRDAWPWVSTQPVALAPVTPVKPMSNALPVPRSTTHESIVTVWPSWAKNPGRPSLLASKCSSPPE